MDNFWKWMEDKGYGGIDKKDGFIFIRQGGNGNTLQGIYNPVKQMLLGFYMEYCLDKGIIWGAPCEETIEGYHDMFVRTIAEDAHG